MAKNETGKQADISAVADRGEAVTMMEPLLVSEESRHRGELTDRTRILLWAEEEIRLDALPPRTGTLLEAVLYRGELPRGEVAGVLGLTPRHARRMVSALIERGVLSSKGPRDPLYLVFPAALAARWMPGLFPEQPQ
jgi:hypothetical protein